MTKLGEQQEKFSGMLARLILYAIDHGYGVRIGEVWRSPEEAERLAKLGAGIQNSWHCKKLAADLNLTKDGYYLRKTEEYEPVGLYWEELGGTWGGRFKRRPDGGHFSLGESPAMTKSVATVASFRGRKQ